MHVGASIKYCNKPVSDWFFSSTSRLVIGKISLNWLTFSSVKSNSVFNRKFPIIMASSTSMLFGVTIVVQLLVSLFRAFKIFIHFEIKSTGKSDFFEPCKFPSVFRGTRIVEIIFGVINPISARSVQVDRALPINPCSNDSEWSSSRNWTNKFVGPEVLLISWRSICCSTNHRNWSVHRKNSWPTIQSSIALFIEFNISQQNKVLSGMIQI